MKRQSDNEELLRDVFGEAAPASLRDAMLGQSLRIVRHRHTVRQVGRAAAWLVVLALGFVLIRPGTPRRNDVLSKSQPTQGEKKFKLVRSQPFSAAAMVTTGALSPGRFVSATAFARIVRTRPDSFRAINDDELMALLSPRPCALIQIGPNLEKLVLVNSGDAGSFPEN